MIGRALGKSNLVNVGKNWHAHLSSWDFGCDPEGQLPITTTQEQKMFCELKEEDHAQQDAIISANPVDDVMLQQFPHPIDSLPLTFGKYKGKTPLEIARSFPGYIVWCSEKKILTGTDELIDWCKRVAERIGPPQARGHLKYGRYR